MTPARFYEFNSESLSVDRTRIQSNAVRKGQRILRSDDWVPGSRSVSGSMEVDMQSKGLGLLLEQMFGGAVVAGAGPYTHTCTPGDLPSMTLQVGRTPITGAVIPFTYTGVTCASWSIACAVNDIAKISLALIGKDEVTSTALATAAYPTAPTFMTFVGGSLTIASGTVANVKSVNLAGDNGLGGQRMYLGSATTEKPVETGRRAYNGTFEVDFTSETLHDYYVDGDENALVLNFSDGDASSLVITMNVRYDGSTPQTNGYDITTQSVGFEAVATAADSTAITAVYTTSDGSL